MTRIDWKRRATALSLIPAALWLTFYCEARMRAEQPRKRIEYFWRYRTALAVAMIELFLLVIYVIAPAIWRQLP